MTSHTEMFNDLLKLAVDSGASDIVVKSNKPGYVRLAGRLKPVDMDPITSPENVNASVCPVSVIHHRPMGLRGPSATKT